MKRSLRIRLEFPTEEQAFTEFEEVLLAFRAAFRADVTIPIKDAVLVARGFFGPAVRAYLRQKKLATDKFGEVNLNRWRVTGRRKRPALAIVERLLQEDGSLRLPRKKSKLALAVHKELGKNAPSLRTIRRWTGEHVDNLIRQAPKK